MEEWLSLRLKAAACVLWDIGEMNVVITVSITGSGSQQIDALRQGVQHFICIPIVLLIIDVVWHFDGLSASGVGGLTFHIICKIICMSPGALHLDV